MMVLTFKLAIAATNSKDRINIINQCYYLSTVQKIKLIQYNTQPLQQRFPNKMSLIDYNTWAIPGLYQSQYSLGVEIALIILTLYCGVFTLLNNFYVFRPKVLGVSIKCKPQAEYKFARVLYDIGITLALNISMVSFAFCTSFLSSSANSLQVFAISDGVWMGLSCAIIAYKNKDTKPEQIQRQLPLKNTVMLLLIYACIVIHFKLELYFFHFPLVLFFLYLVNQVMTQYFDKVKQAIKFLLSDSSEEDMNTNQIKKRKPKSQFPSINLLASCHAPADYEISHIKQQFAARRSHIVLKSKAKVYEKLHDIYIKVHRAHTKFIESQIRRVICYYGRLNGTIPLQKHETNTFADKPTVTLSQPNLTSYNKIETGNEQDINQALQQEQLIIEDPPDFIQYIFPIKLFQYSVPISVVFSILLNLGFGFLIDYSLQANVKLGYGTIFCCLAAFTMIPILPSGTSLVDAFTLNSSFSISRYGILGLFLFISCFISMKQGELFNVTWIITPNLSWLMIAQAGFLVYAAAIALVFRWQQYRLLGLVFVMLIGAFGYLGFLDSYFIF